MPFAWRRRQQGRRLPGGLASSARPLLRTGREGGSAMNDTGVVDTFLNTFTTYIDSGFGLLGGEVHFLSATLVVIDVTLAALFWAWAPGEDMLARLIKKTLYVGFFAFLIGNFNNLAKIVFESFSGLGLKAAGGGMSAADFLHPGKIAQQGISAGMPILQAV